jgi:transcriptional regulator with XRE-family HTH domain
MNRPKTRLGHLVRTLRQDRQLTQEDLAKLTGLPTATISRIESGVHKNPYVTSLQSLSKAFGDGNPGKVSEIFLVLAQALDTSVDKFSTN